MLRVRHALLVMLALGINSLGSDMAKAESDGSARIEATPAPVLMMRTLQLMQDQIAIGVSEAHIGQRGLLAILDDRFMMLEDASWQDTRNVRAAVVFALSGGKPQILRKILSPRLIPMEDVPLVEGSLAYVEGREEEARRALMPINPVILPATLGAHLALVQSALVVRNDPERSMELLDYVRLQAPGTLLDEAALRRQVFVASQLENDQKFEFLVRHYLTRYRRSVYAGNFRQRLASALTRIDFAKDPDRFARLTEMLQDLEPEVRKELFLLAARTSIQNGRIKSALLTSERALRLAEDDQQAAMRARLYHAAAMITSPTSLIVGLDELTSIRRSLLPASDVRLLDEAISMANQIRRLPGDPVEKVDDHPPADVSPPMQAPEQIPALSKAQEALRRVDRLIKN